MGTCCNDIYIKVTTQNNMQILKLIWNKLVNNNKSTYSFVIENRKQYNDFVKRTSRKI